LFCHPKVTLTEKFGLEPLPVEADPTVEDILVSQEEVGEEGDAADEERKD
jgi:hypothetical protein